VFQKSDTPTHTDKLVSSSFGTPSVASWCHTTQLSSNVFSLQDIRDVISFLCTD